jgi:signal transduction histidine kinase/CheY-like chemotaxis protein/HPt (histidine-containing phosphotransfer) domain-containing protein
MSAAAEAHLLMTDDRPGRKRWWREYRAHLSAAGLGVLFIGVVWAGLLLHVRERESVTLEQARRDVANLAIALEEQVERTFLSIDQIMRFAQTAYEADPMGFDLKTWFDQVTFLRPISLQVAVADAGGNVLASSLGVPAGPPPNIADREHFRIHLDRSDAGLFISRPVLGRLSGKWSIQLSRRLTGPDGQFMGVLVVSLDPDYLSDLLARIDVGSSGSVVLMRRDGYALARAPVVEGLFERPPLDVPASLAACAEAPAPAGTCRLASTFDQVERVFGFRSLKELPLTVAVGQSVETVENQLRAQHVQEVALGLLTTAAVAAIVVLLLRQLEIRRRRDAELLDSQSRLKANTAHLAATLDNIDQGLLMIDPAGRVQVCNRRAIELLHLPPDIMDRQPTFDMILDLQVAQGEMSEKAQETHRRSFLTLEANASFVYERDCRDGTILEIRTVRLADNSAVRTYTDITKRKEAECAAERARIEAERVSEAKTEFLASMSHEIRTPLNSILGFTGLLLERSDLDSEVKRQVQLIQGSGSALLTVVNDVLDFSKIEAGQVDLDPRSFETRALIDDTLSIVRGLAGAKRLDIRAEIDPDLPPWLMGDEDRIRQILLNFLNNAVKFTREGHVTLAVQRLAATGDGDRVRFAVSDTGIGIPKAKQHLLFQRFSQIDGSIRREFGGTGLGLAISQRLVELMGGEIGVDSEHRQGSTFWFTVTLPRSEPTSPRADPPPEWHANSRKARILLAEDVEVNQEIARAVLEGAGHSVDVVSDGSEAIMAVQECEYDLVLMDIQMPVVDGVTATRRIRELEGPSGHIPIIAMTANVLPEQVARFAAAGMTGHVGKPFKRDELYEVIERIMSNAPEAETERAAAPARTRAIDEAAYGSLLSIMGPPGVKRLLDGLEQRLRTLLGSQVLTPEDRHRLAGDAHALVSAAGMLGFLQLSQVFRDLESACLEGGNLDPVLGEMETSLQAALSEIAVLKEAA